MVNEDQMGKNSRDNAAMLSSIWNILGGMLGCPLLGFLIGKKIDHVVMATLIGVVIGGLYCALEVWKILRRFKS